MSDSALHVNIKDLLYIFGLKKQNKLAIKTKVEKPRRVQWYDDSS